MASTLLYVTDETKALVEQVAKLDDRTQDGEVSFLCKQRLKQLNVPESADSSVKDGNSTTLGVGSQEESGK